MNLSSFSDEHMGFVRNPPASMWMRRRRDRQGLSVNLPVPHTECPTDTQVA